MKNKNNGFLNIDLTDFVNLTIDSVNDEEAKDLTNDIKKDLAKIEEAIKLGKPVNSIYDGEFGEVGYHYGTLNIMFFLSDGAIYGGRFSLFWAGDNGGEFSVVDFQIADDAVTGTLKSVAYESEGE